MLVWQGTISKERFVGPYVGKTISDLVNDAGNRMLYIDLHSRLRPSVSCLLVYISAGVYGVLILCCFPCMAAENKAVNIGHIYNVSLPDSGTQR